jgi:hypothetical protein
MKPPRRTNVPKKRNVADDISRRYRSDNKRQKVSEPTNPRSLRSYRNSGKLGKRFKIAPADVVKKTNNGDSDVFPYIFPINLS